MTARRQSERGVYALYYTSKFGKGVPFVRVRIMSQEDKAGTVSVRVTSNNHPCYPHGLRKRVSRASLSNFYSQGDAK